MKYFAKNQSERRHNKRLLLALMSCTIALVTVIGVMIITDRIWVKDNAHISKAARKELTSLVYDGEISVEIDSNKPNFSKDEIKKAKAGGFEEYSKLDSLGRCGPAEASVCIDTMPVEGEKRTSLGSVYPSGWQSISFWCRCHLIGWQLTAENDNDRNLITGTTRMNMSGMLPYENRIAKYVEENPDYHVLYRVEPLYEGNNLVANGVNLQAESVEDKGNGISFNVYVFNFQPGYIIDYKNGMVDDDPEHQTTIILYDKRARYTGEPVLIDGARVKGSTGEIRYIYYTDKDAKNKTTEINGSESNGSPPSCRGRYYVRSVISGDNWYPAAASNVAELEIY